MKISSNAASTMLGTNTNSVKTNFTEKISQKEAEEIKAQVVENANAFALKSMNVQNSFASKQSDFAKEHEDFKSFLNDIGYKGAPIATLSQDEAAALVAEDGIFGIKQTATRIADFVINGAGGDEERLRAGREGMLRGFQMAEEMWGEKLPEISQKTIQAATEMVDKVMIDFGFSLINKEA